jgi:hypothetical protein
MSHSYRQSPIVGRHSHNGIVKKETNRLIRRLPIDTEVLGDHNVYRRQANTSFSGRGERKWYVPTTSRSYHVNMKITHIPKADVIRQAESFHKLLHNNRRDRQRIRDTKQLYLLQHTDVIE